MSSPERQERQPALEQVDEVSPGVLRIQLPIHLPGLGHVNCYVLEDAEGVVVIDPGLPDPETHRVLTERLGEVGLRVEDITRVVVTHSHPDHFGGAGRLRLTNDAQIIAERHFKTIFDPRDDDSVELLDAKAPKVDDAGFDPADFANYLLGDGEIPDIPARVAPWGGEIPFPGRDEIAGMRAWDDQTKQGFLTPQPTRRLDDAEVISLGRRDWIAVYTPGHTGDHLCLFQPDDGILLAGDHVLPTITPHISGMTSSDDSLADYIEALDKVCGLPGVRSVLPAHGLVFDDLCDRVEAIKRHHHERLEALVLAAHGDGELDVVEFSHRLFQPRSWGSMAESETYAHLEHLRRLGVAESRREGVSLRYRITGEVPPFELTGATS